MICNSIINLKYVCHPPYHHSSSNNKTTSTPTGTEENQVPAFVRSRKTRQTSLQKNSAQCTHIMDIFMARQGRNQSDVQTPPPSFEQHGHGVGSCACFSWLCCIFIFVSRVTNIGQGAVYRGQLAWRITHTRHIHHSRRHVQVHPYILNARHQSPSPSIVPFLMVVFCWDVDCRDGISMLVSYPLRVSCWSTCIRDDGGHLLLLPWLIVEVTQSENTLCSTLCLCLRVSSFLPSSHSNEMMLFVCARCGFGTRKDWTSERGKTAWSTCFVWTRPSAKKGTFMHEQGDSLLFTRSNGHLLSSIVFVNVYVHAHAFNGPHSHSDFKNRAGANLKEHECNRQQTNKPIFHMLFFGPHLFRCCRIT